jgi:hypothetical protein
MVAAYCDRPSPTRSVYKIAFPGAPAIAGDLNDFDQVDGDRRFMSQYVGYLLDLVARPATAVAELR